MVSNGQDADAGIEVERDAGITTIRFNRPARKNALRGRDFAEFTRALEAVNADPDTRVVVLTGAGGHFCAGADLSDLSGAGGPRATVTLMWSLQSAARALHRVRVPVLAAVTGFAVGAGSSFALGADLVYAASSARLGQLFVDRALSLDLGASWVLTRRVGLSRAKELAFTGAMVPADQAERIGLVDGVFADGELDAAVAERARAIAEKPPLALTMIKDQLNRAVTSSFDEALDYESLGQSLAGVSRDAAEALVAFAEKRPPAFSGH
jgi:2-(1,2-epoxy-1,2-dihydrophenyl)acetyl-CoA isomerase